MYVRVKIQEKSYYSQVFAYYHFDYMPYYLVFDPISDKFDIVAYFSQSCDGHRQIGFMDERENDFVQIPEMNLSCGVVTKVRGYSWILENPSLILDIEKGNPAPDKYVKMAKEINATLNPSAWNTVSTPCDAENFLNHVGGFHDWYLVGIEGKSDPYHCSVNAKVRLHFTSQSAFDVIVEFEEGIFINYGLASANRIYLSTILFNDGHIYWIDGEEEISPEEIENYNYIQGNQLRWKFVVKENENW